MDSLKNNSSIVIHHPERLSEPGSMRKKRGGTLSVDRTVQQREAKKGKGNMSHAEKISKSLQRFMDLKNVRVEFQVRESAQEITIKVINEKSGRVIREIPVEQIHKLTESKELTKGGFIETLI